MVSIILSTIIYNKIRTIYYSEGIFLRKKLPHRSVYVFPTLLTLISNERQSTSRASLMFFDESEPEKVLSSRLLSATLTLQSKLDSMVFTTFDSEVPSKAR